MAARHRFIASPIAACAETAATPRIAMAPPAPPAPPPIPAAKRTGSTATPTPSISTAARRRARPVDKKEKATAREVGPIATDSALPDQEGNYIKLNRLVEENAATVVYFFPQADTPGCTREACTFRDGMAEFRARKIG